MTVRSTFTLDEELAKQARRLNINVSAGARDGVASAVRAALIAADRSGYQDIPERVDSYWESAEAWGSE